MERAAILHYHFALRLLVAPGQHGRALGCVPAPDAIDPVHHVVGLPCRLAALVAFGQVGPPVVSGRLDLKRGHVVRDGVEPQGRIPPANFDRLVRGGVHAPGESERPAQLPELTGGHPGVRHLAVVPQQRNQPGAGTPVRYAVTEKVLDKIHLVRQQVAGVTGAVGVVTPPVPKVAPTKRLRSEWGRPDNHCR